MMSGDTVDHGIADAIAFDKISPDKRMRAFHMMVYRLANVMQQPAHFGDIDVSAQFHRDHPGDMSRFDSMGMLILPIAAAELQLSQQLENFDMQTVNAGFISRSLALFAYNLLNFRV